MQYLNDTVITIQTKDRLMQAKATTKGWEIWIDNKLWCVLDDKTLFEYLNYPELFYQHDNETDNV